ncbi:hypothetical protein HGI30_13230 [Paenibacillus albicereus]|uniref:Uncharacterized protein n=1 Tax=Paenibacillus albicereus TaxID=2726185 RepID=A0A6H2GYD6_9BACL|nr:hypothetical protein [Paenibacillus albicereus]QJC52430.1 hypothetical protein HGI30_13230 [Paenibacillus albicereus]
MKRRLCHAAALAALLGLAAGCQGAWTLSGPAEPVQRAGEAESVRSELYPDSVRSALYGQSVPSEDGPSPQRRHDRDRMWKQPY